MIQELHELKSEIVVNNSAPKPLELINRPFFDTISVVIKISINTTSLVDEGAGNLVLSAGDRCNWSYLEN